jgi:hypothetical protein
MSASTTEQIKPTTSQKRIDANRINASRSTGPRTDAGKSRSKYNNLSHGECARTLVVLPGEDAEQIARDAEETVQNLAAGSEAERQLALEYQATIETIKRCRKAEGAALNLKINEIRDQAADGPAAEVATLGARLLDGQDLDSTLEQLRKTAAGCVFLKNQWLILSKHLDSFSSFNPMQRVLAIRLCGKRGCDLFRDGVVRDWVLAVLGACYGSTGVEPEVVAGLLALDRPELMSVDEFTYEISILLRYLPSMREGSALLRQKVAAAIKELDERIEVLTDREARDLEHRIDAARVDGTPEGKNRRHYLAASIRNLKALRVEIEALQAKRLEQGDDDEPEAPEPAENRAGKSEPNAADAPEPAGGSPEPAPSVRPEVLATLGALALGAWEVLRHQLE